MVLENRAGVSGQRHCPEHRVAQVRIGFGELIAVARVRTGVLLRRGCVKLINRVALFAYLMGLLKIHAHLRPGTWLGDVLL